MQLAVESGISVGGVGRTLISDALAAVNRVPGQQAPVVVRADSAYFNSKVAKAALNNGADLSVTVKMLTTVKEKIREIPDDAWTRIEYPQAIFDESSGTWISKAEVAEIPFTAFFSKKEAEQVTGRFIVRRVPELNETKRARGQDPLFDTSGLST